MSSTVDRSGAAWFKSSYSNGQSSCVEVAYLGSGEVGLRDTKHVGTGPVLAVSVSEWDAFIRAATEGAFDGA